MSTYGRACANCAKAKSKCLLRQEGESCERCHRLRKLCLPSVSTRPQASSASRRPPRQNLASRVDPLEQKLDRLARLIQEQRQSQQQANLSCDIRPGTGELSSQVLGSQVISNSGSDGLISLSASFSDGEPSSDGRIPLDIFPCRGEPCDTLAEQYLTTFRTHMLQFFPVIHLSTTTTAQQLKADKPFLWLCIMAVSCSSTGEQLLLGDSVREIISREIVFQSKRSLDLLLGTLTFIAWSHYQTRYMAFLTDITQVAMSLVYDLGLNKASQEPRGRNCFRQASREKPYYARPKTPSGGPTTMEGHRALLGCFLLSSTIAQTLKRMDGLRWTHQMDISLAKLGKHPEGPGDKTLAILVRLRLVSAEVTYSHCTWPFGNSVYTSKTLVSTHYLEMLLSQLERIKNEIPTELSNNAAVWNEYRCTSLLLHEAYLGQPVSFSYRPDSERIEKFSTCFMTLKQWFESFLEIPPPQYVGFTFCSMCSLAYSLLMLFRFSTLSDPGWEKEKVRESVNILDITDKLILNYEYIARTFRSVDNHEDKDFFIDGARMFRFMRNTWKRELDLRIASQDDADRNQEGPIDLEQLSIDPEFTMDWIGTPFLIDILSYP